MSYLLSREHDELRAMVRELADEQVAPRAAQIDESGEFPWDLKELLAKQDLIGTCFPEAHGGTALDTIAQSILRRGAGQGRCDHQPHPDRPEARRPADPHRRDR